MRDDALDPAELAVPGGVASRAQWRSAGASNRMFTDGRLVPIVKNVFALPGAVDSPRAVAKLVGALAPPGAIVTGWAAALLHGVRDAGPTMLRSSGTPIQVCLSRQDHRGPAGFATLRVDVEDDQVEVVDGVAVTTPTRTAYDLVRFSRYLTGAVALLDAFRCPLSTRPVQLDGLYALIENRPRGRGHPMLRKAIELSSGRARSMPESVLRTRLRTVLDLPAAALLVNASLRTLGRDWEIDLIDLSSGLALEYDSEHHASTEQRERDALKDLEVGEVGLGMARINAHTLARAGEDFAEHIGRAQRRARLGGGVAHAQRAVDEGRIRELPLRDYTSAVE